MADDLSSKYGRRKTGDSSSQQRQSAESNNNDSIFSKYSRGGQQQRQTNSDNTVNKYSRNTANTSSTPNMPDMSYIREASNAQTEKKGISGTGMHKDFVRKNVAEALSKYSSDNQNNAQQEQTAPVKAKSTEETPVVKFLKAVVSVLIIFVVICIVVAILMRGKVNEEGEMIINQINKAELAYYSVYGKYYFFTKTSYDSALGIDINECKYFDSCEVIQDKENNNYEVKLYGATNAFSITYYAVKSFFKS